MPREASLQSGAIPRVLVEPSADEASRLEFDPLESVPLLYATWGEGIPDLEFLRCPRCGGLRVTPSHLDLIVGDDYAIESAARIDVKRGGSNALVVESSGLRGDTSPRGSTVGVAFLCEQGHRFLLEFGCHEGLTFAQMHSWEVEAGAGLGVRDL